MNWIRDNILKILIILGVAIVAIIVIALIFRPKEKDELVSGTKYGELENKLQDAAIRYINNHKKLLPTTTDNITKIKLSTLVGNNYIGKLVAVDNSNVKCDGYVEISKISEDESKYRYTPFVSCGNYYRTKTIGEYIVDLETEEGKFERTTDSGLYKMGDEYIFKGEEVKNVIKLDDHYYRIVKIDKDNQLELISVSSTNGSYVWDDRYNIVTDEEDGINDFVKSRLHDSLIKLYENSDPENEEVFFSSEEKNYIVQHDFCIGKRSSTDSGIHAETECKETMPLYVGLVNVHEYARASLDSNCKTIFDKSCVNYNYFKSLGRADNYSYLTLTGVADNNYQVFKIKYAEIVGTAASNSNQLHPVIYINSRTIYASGSGTFEDPYIVR